MNREEHEKIIVALIKDSQFYIDGNKIGELFDAHEAQLKAKDDKYHELKDLFNSLDEQHDLLKLKNIELVERGNRTCEGCKHWNKRRFCEIGVSSGDIGGCGDYWEKKNAK